MSRSYKIAIVLALVLIAGIVSYHTIQSNDQSPAVSVGDSAPPRSDVSATSDTAHQSGIGDLMSRVRTHIDSADQSSQSPKPITSPQANTDQNTTPASLVDPAAQSTTPPPSQAVAVQAPRTKPIVPIVQHDPPTSTTPAVAMTNTAPVTPQANTQQRLVRGHRANVHASPPVQANAPREPREYIIESGDTFSSIAIRFYGSAEHWIDIAAANPFANPKRLRVGQAIRLPHPQDVLSPQPQAVAVSGRDAPTHIVRPGESLYTIATRYYKDPGLWRAIFDANRETIGTDPDRLQAGMVLTIPPEHLPLP